MNKSFTPETIREVLGTFGSAPGGSLNRTALHVEYGAGVDSFSRSVMIDEIDDDQLFNAVGSKVRREGADIHLPVIDVDGGAEIQRIRIQGKEMLGSKAILGTVRDGQYGPRRLLRDVLGDYGIDLEVFQAPDLEHSDFLQRTYHRGQIVTGLVLRSKEAGTFAAVDSTQEGHSHLYIQKRFKGPDHSTLIDELAEVGVISVDWHLLTQTEGMGIVRTPWTKKEVTHRPT